MPAGSYHLRVVSNILPIGGVSQNFEYHYMKQNISYLLSLVEFYYQGFEEFSGATASTIPSPSYAGRFYYTGDYTVPFVIPNSRSYVVEYHYWNGTKWINVKKPFTSAMTLTEGTAIDEVRVYPSDSQMTTYTYDPLTGMTSSSDENNYTTYYEYDSFGKLKCIKDQDKNILKVYDYHYKDQVINP
jgi:YD repeat-containing protein